MKLSGAYYASLLQHITNTCQPDKFAEMIGQKQ